MYQVLFEANDAATIRGIIILLIGIAASLLLIWRFIVQCRKRKMNLSKFFSDYFMIAIFCIAILSIPIKIFSQRAEIYDKYINGEFFIEEGEVRIVYNEENINAYHFIINETVFSLDSRQVYNYAWDRDELCVSDNQRIRVSYVTYRGKNLIMKIEKVLD